jgi:hypothetical protein
MLPDNWRQMNHERPLDIDVAVRQCFGGMYEKSSLDARLTRDLLAGKLSISPHPVWAIPEVLTWTEDPFNQRNWRAQLQMLRWLEPVRRSAMDGDEAAREYWVSSVRSWVRANPRGRSEADFAWADMVEAIRGMCLVFGLPLLHGEDQTWLLEAIWEHGEWMADPEHLGKANHALHQHQSLFVIGALFENSEWKSLAHGRMLELFDKSYDVEGINDEGSLGYHKNNYIWWRTAIKRLQIEGLSTSSATNRLDLALIELAHATRPDGYLELIGDTETATLGALSSPEIDYVKSSGSLGRPPAALTKVYSRGYVFGRSGWGEYERDFRDELFYSLSFGRGDRVHGHADGASITLHANGHPWLVDSGKFAYVADPMRTYCLSRSGHNVVTVADVPYDRSTHVELVSHSLSTELDEYVFRDIGYDGVEIIRHVVYSRGGDFLVVLDTISSTRGTITANQRWHLDSESSLSPIRNGYRITHQGSTATLLWSGTVPTLSVIKGQESPTDGWTSTKWMRKDAAPVIQATKTGSRVGFITVISALKTGHFTLDNVESKDGTLLISATSGRNQLHLKLDRKGSQISTVGAGAQKSTSTLSHIQNMLDEYQSPVENLPLAIQDCHDYSPKLWEKCRVWISSCDDSKLARVRILRHFLHILMNEESNDTNDRGLRAAILDLAGEDIAREVGLSSGNLNIMREPLIGWSGLSLRSRTYNAPISTVTSPREMADPSEHPSVTTALVGGLTLPFIARKGLTDVLTVRFHGAINRTRTSLPLFQGLTSSNQSNDNYMIFHDPSLDLNRSMSLSWFLGLADKNLHQVCASYIAEFAKRASIKHIVLTGSSGGGFTALQVASYLPESKALVFNPQTDIRRYFETTAETATSTCFGQSAAGLEPSLNTRVSVISRYRELSVLPKVMYVQNSGDTHHVENHRDPFESMLSAHHREQASQIKFVDEFWGPGHQAPDATQYKAFQDRMNHWIHTENMSNDSVS